MRAAAVMLVLLCMLAATDVKCQTAIPVHINVSTDADGFDALRLRSGFLFRYGSPFDYAGVGVQSTRYTFGDWDRNAPAAFALWRKQDPATLAGSIAEVGVVQVNGKTRVIGDATWSLRPNARTGVEVLMSGDLVETRRALDRGTAYTFFGLSAERQLTERFTAIGLAGVQNFTDGNERTHLRARLIWLLLPDHGLSAQVRWRQFESDGVVPNDYFNPERYAEWQAGLILRKRYRGWLWYGTLGGGRETIDNDVTNPTALIELRTEGTMRSGTRVALHGSYNRSAGFGTSDDYWYRSLGVTVTVPIGSR